MLDDDFELGGLGSRPARHWVSVDNTPPPVQKRCVRCEAGRGCPEDADSISLRLPCRRTNKTLKREVQAAAREAVELAIAAKAGSPKLRVQLDPAEVQQITRTAMVDTYQRIKLRKEPRDPSMRCLSRENDEGNVEYKWRLKDAHAGNPYRLQQLVRGREGVWGAASPSMHGRREGFWGAAILHAPVTRGTCMHAAPSLCLVACACRLACVCLQSAHGHA